MLKSFTLLRIQDGWKSPGAAALADTLSRGEFVPCGPSQPRSAGWVPPRGVAHAPLVEAVGGQYLMKLMMESRQLPSSVVKAQLEERLDVAEAQTGRRPRGKLKKEMKEQVEHELLPRAFTRKAGTLVWLDPKARLLVLGTTTAKVLDTVLAELGAAFEDKLPLMPLDTELSPAVAMTNWLMEQEPPAGFSLDRDCELRQPDEERATVRYARHALDAQWVADHLQQGKQPVQLGLTWASRVSFVLTDELKVKRIKFLDVDEAGSPSAGGKPEDSFDGDAALMTGELSQMLVALLGALGGEAAHR